MLGIRHSFSLTRERSDLGTKKSHNALFNHLELSIPSGDSGKILPRVVLIHKYGECVMSILSGAWLEIAGDREGALRNIGSAGVPAPTGQFK